MTDRTLTSKYCYVVAYLEECHTVAMVSVSGSKHRAAGWYLQIADGVQATRFFGPFDTPQAAFAAVPNTTETLPPRITVMDDGRAMGGSDVCHTCAAHCTVINDLETALRGLYWDNVDYLTLNKLGGMQNHWMRAARMALGMDVDDVRPTQKASEPHMHIWSHNSIRNPLPEQVCDQPGCGLKWKDRFAESEGECHIRPHDLCSAGTCKVCVDAARYRWLQDNGVLVLDETLTGDALDIAVDAERRHALQIANSVDCTQCPHPDACEASGGCPKIEGGDGG